MVTIEDLKNYAGRLMFDMDEDGYMRTLKEFEVIEKHMALIGKIDGIENVEPMTFPYTIYHANFREDKEKNLLKTEDVLKNAKEVKADQIKVPKVVGQ